MTEKMLEKCIVEYFICLHKTDEKWKELVTSYERPLNSLKNQAQQLRLVSDAALDKADLCVTDGGFRGKLIFRINVAMEDEIAMIWDINSEFNNANQGLKSKLEKLEASRSKADLNEPEMQELIIGTPTRPRLNLLMEWAIDSSNYYNESYSSINTCLRNLDCKKEETVDNLTESLVRKKIKRENIDRILGFTQFLVAKEN